VIPDMGADVPLGQHQVVVEVTLNGQQYSSNGISFLFNCTSFPLTSAVDPNLSEEELKKLDDADEKAAKKGGAKKR